MADICDYEDTVTAALESGFVSTGVRRHLKSCRTCGEAELVWKYLHSLASEDKCDSPLPSAGLIWWRAQLGERRRLAALSVAGIEVMQKAAAVLIAGFLVIAAALWGSRIFAGVTLSAPVALAALLMTSGLVGGIIYAWVQGHSVRVFARQR